MTDLERLMPPTRDEAADEEPVEAEQHEHGEGAVAGFQGRARELADRVALEVQDHPLRALAIAGLVGFLVASSMKHRNLSAMLRSGAGIAAAMALREIAARGLSRVDVGAA